MWTQKPVRAHSSTLVSGKTRAVFLRPKLNVCFRLRVLMCHTILPALLPQWPVVPTRFQKRGSAVFVGRRPSEQYYCKDNERLATLVDRTSETFEEVICPGEIHFIGDIFLQCAEPVLRRTRRQRNPFQCQALSRMRRLPGPPATGSLPAGPVQRHPFPGPRLASF